MANHSTHIMTDVRHYGFKGVVITESVGFVDHFFFGCLLRDKLRVYNGTEDMQSVFLPRTLTV